MMSPPTCEPTADRLFQVALPTSPLRWPGHATLEDAVQSPSVPNRRPGRRTPPWLALIPSLNKQHLKWVERAKESKVDIFIAHPVRGEHVVVANDGRAVVARKAVSQHLQQR